MNDTRFTLRAAVYLLLIKGNKIMLLRRFNTGWEDGNYSLVAGHLDGRETVKEAMIREAKEESNIELNKEDLHVVHIIHRESRESTGDLEYIDFFLTADKWIGEPKIMEKDKSDDMGWFSLDNLPANTLSHVKQALENYKRNIYFSEFK